MLYYSSKQRKIEHSITLHTEAYHQAQSNLNIVTYQPKSKYNHKYQKTEKSTKLLEEKLLFKNVSLFSNVSGMQL